jgi:stage V sporulation protein G
METNVKLEVRAYPIDEPKGSTLAFASIAIDDKVAINGIRVVQSERGVFVSMPQSRDKDGGYHDYISVKDYDLMKAIRQGVIAEYKKMAVLPSEQRGYAKTDASDRTEDTALDVKIFPIREPKGNTLAFAAVSVDELLEISGIRVVDSEKGLFMAMPQSQDKTGEFHDIVYPIVKGLRGEMENALINAYYEEQSSDRSADRNSFSDKLAEGAQKSAEYAHGKASQPLAMSAKRSPGIGG